MSDKYPGGFVTAGAPAGFSVAFDGTGDYLSGVPSTAYDFGTSEAYSVEFWAYLNSVPSSFAFTGGNTTGAFGINYDTGGGYLKCGKAGVGNQLTTSYVLSSGQWYHIVFCRQSGTLSAFVNGTRVATTSDSTSYTATAGFIGGDTSFASMNGYLSNFRIVTGASAYNPSATTLTVPTQLFPITNTAILTCQSPTIIDNSGNAVTLTANGDAKVSNFTPFAAYTGFNPALGAAAGGVWTLDEAAYYQNNRQWPIYDPYFKNTTLMLHGNGTNGAQNNTFLDSSTNNFTITRNGNTTQGTFTPFSQTGWSNYFDGTSTSFLSFPSNSALALGNGAYTVEGWLYQTARASSDALFYSSSYATANADAFIGYIKNNGSISIEKAFSGAVLTTAANAVPLNTWCHIAFVRTSTTTNGTSIYVNGVAVATGTDSNNWSNYNAPGIGMLSSTPAYGIFGYISNFRLVKGTAVYTSNFTPSTQPLTAIANTSLLTCQGNRFVDASANNFTVTSAGAVSAQAFSPFVPAYITPTTYSNWFDGTNSYLSVDSSSSMFPLSDFTMECWVIWNGSSGPYNAIYHNYDDGTNLGFNWLVTSTGVIHVNVNGTSNNGSVTLETGRLYHLALVRSGSTITRYINGIADPTTVTQGTAIAATTKNQIGGAPIAGGRWWSGIISNLRVLNYALYTANFTPPTAPLTAISGTKLLTCQNSTFIDNSSNNFSLTAFGNVKPTTSPTPFPAKVDTTTLNSAYSTALMGASMYSAAAGDGLSFLTSSTQFGVSGDFTIEAWVYPIATASNYNTVFQVCATTSSDNNSYGLYYNSSYNLFWLNSGGGGNGFDAGSGINIVPYQWNHVAISRSSGTIRCWTNGTLRISGWGTSGIDGTQRFLYAGCSRNLGDSVPGYISSFRFVNGTAVYPTAANFAPPILPLANISNTAALVNSTNGAIFDNTAKNVVQTVGTAAISTVQSKYGGSSMKFDGSTSSWLLIPFSRNLDISTGAPDWTLECWGYVVSFANSPYFFNKGGVAASTYTNYAFSMNTSGVVFCTLGNNGGETSYSFGTCATNTWYHFAATRQGSTIRTFLNGVLVTSQSIATTMTDNGEALYVGCLKNLTSNVLNGYVDDLRITKGVARYTTNFTPPTSQLQDQ